MGADFVFPNRSKRDASSGLAPVTTATVPSMLLPILFVADFLHPVDGLAVQPFLNGKSVVKVIVVADKLVNIVVR